MPTPQITLSRTIYDPALKDFVFDSPEAKAMPNIRKWIDNENPVIYWYILRIDNASALPLEQWAVELYMHQALSVPDAYIDGINHRFELRKREHDSWSDKYVLSIPEQLGIPIVENGTRRIFFKIDVNCKEGLMHEYGISGKFIAKGVEPVDIREKLFCYSCKVGEFRQIFNNNPDEASIYAEKRLSSRYSSNSVQIFTNSFRMIYDLCQYCHSDSIGRDELLHKLNLLQASFESIPEIADERINPLLNTGIKELTVLGMDRMNEFKSRYLRLCDSLVELLHIEVMNVNLQENKVNFSSITQKIPPENQNSGNINGGFKTENGQLRCPVCNNLIDSSNRSLLCGKCGAQFCQICEGWFREERKRGEEPLCKNCFTAKQERLRTEEEERIRREKEEERIRRKKEEQDRLKKQKEEEDRRKLSNSVGMEFVKIPSGEFMMGSNEYNDEGPVHKVTIRVPFLLGKYPVTQEQWKSVMGSNPSRFEGDDLPVEKVSWDDAQKFIQKLNQKEGTDEYMLPSEAEWEYACRAGTTTRYSFGNDESKLKDYCWYSGYSTYEEWDKNKDQIYKEGHTHPVGQKKPNSWGLYDMHGNVWEWCQDRWHDNYNGAPGDGSAWEGGSSSDRVYRGGGWFSLAGDCRSADRYGCVPGSRYIDLGFRVLRKL